MEQADPAQSKTQGGKLLGCGARSRPAGVVQWNLGGQPVQTVDMVLADAEFVFCKKWRELRRVSTLRMGRTFIGFFIVIPLIIVGWQLAFRKTCWTV